MKLFDLLNTLIYLDREFVAGAYEAFTGTAPVTQITKNESANAGASITLFSAGLSSNESRTFSVSTPNMLLNILPNLDGILAIENMPTGDCQPSKIGWVIGDLGIFRVNIRRNGQDLIASETYFGLRCKAGLKLALITSPDYFHSGLGALTRLSETVVNKASIPVKALVRIHSSQSSLDEWIATPHVILERS